MSAEAVRRTSEPPKGPRLGAWLAMAIELGIVLTFFANSSGIGLLLCGAYAWFSATWSILEGRAK